MTKISETLDAAADTLERDGWVQNDYHVVRDDKICHCTLGAIGLASGFHVQVRIVESEYEKAVDWDFLRWAGGGTRPVEGVVYDEAAAYLAAFVGETPRASRIPDWNDSLTRTAENVIATIRAAAQAAREEGK